MSDKIAVLGSKYGDFAFAQQKIIIRGSKLERHPEYKYKIGSLDPENLWIYINDSNESGWEENLFYGDSDDSFLGPVEFLLRIKDKMKWNIREVGHFSYQFIEDELKMTFQWDDLFGFTVAIKDWKRINEALKCLQEYTDK